MELKQTLHQEGEEPEFSRIEIAIMRIGANQLYELTRDIWTRVRLLRYGNGEDVRDFESELLSFARTAKDKEVKSDFMVTGDLSVNLTGRYIQGVYNYLSSLEVYPEVDLAEEVSDQVCQILKWSMGKKQRIVRHLIDTQANYVVFTDNPLFLQQQTLADVENALGLSGSAVEYLLESLWIEFPDREVRHARFLMPGNKISRIKGDYALDQLQSNSDFFSKERGWIKGSKKITDEIFRRYGLRLAPRTIRKYLTEREDKREVPGEWREDLINIIDSLLAKYMNRDELFDKDEGKWRKRTTIIRRLIRQETGWVIPKQWIEFGKFAKCNKSPDNLVKRIHRKEGFGS